MEKNYSVYVHIFPNKKRYIGITANDPIKRWNYGIGYNQQIRMKRAVKKYGWKNIEHIILFGNLSKEEACQKEKNLIKQYKSNNPRYGYNISAGGEDGNIGIKRSDKQREYIRKRCTEEHGKAVIHLFLDENEIIVGQEIFNSIAEASEKTGTSKNTISKICKEKWCEHYFEHRSGCRSWAYFDEFYKESVLVQTDDPALYRFLLNKGIYDEQFIILMNANIDFWRNLTKYDKNIRKSSESQVKKVVI